MEEQPLEAIRAAPARPGAVDRIAGDRMPDRGEMDPDLVGPTGDEVELEERPAVEPLADAVARRRRPAVGDDGASLVRSFGSRPIGASIRPTAAATDPATRARYVFLTRRALSWAMRLCWAASCLATMMSPLVSRSSRWTMPGRWTPAMPPKSSPPGRAGR